jgi:hypothetical protein
MPFCSLGASYIGDPRHQRRVDTKSDLIYQVQAVEGWHVRHLAGSARDFAMVSGFVAKDESRIWVERRREASWYAIPRLARKRVKRINPFGRQGASIQPCKQLSIAVVQGGSSLAGNEENEEKRNVLLGGQERISEINVIWNFAIVAAFAENTMTSHRN